MSSVLTKKREIRSPHKATEVILLKNNLRKIFTKTYTPPIMTLKENYMEIN